MFVELHRGSGDLHLPSGSFSLSGLPSRSALVLQVEVLVQVLSVRGAKCCNVMRNR